MKHSKEDLEELITILARGINKASLESPNKYVEKMFRAYRTYQEDYKKQYGKEYSGIRDVKINV
jgi:hypothetical protein